MSAARPEDADAFIRQVPAETSVTWDPDTLQTSAEAEPKTTGRPDDEVAESETLFDPRTASGGCVNETDWDWQAWNELPATVPTKGEELNGGDAEGLPANAGMTVGLNGPSEAAILNRRC